MFSVFTNAWKVKDIRKKLLYAVMVVAVYRLGSAIPLPGINLTAWQFVRSSGTNRTLFATIAGGGIGTIFQMGIGPYITSSIIMQLLTVAIPRLEQMQKEGEEGRKKINQYTRIVAVALAALQGAGTVFSLNADGLFIHANMLTWIMATLSLVTGTIFVMWLSELATERGIGNGSSFIIFSNILAGVPSSLMRMYSYAASNGAVGVIVTLVLAVAFILLIAFAILIQDGERRIPVQYSKKMVGRQMYGGQSSYIPIKVNIAGVMAIIFAISLVQLPATIYGFFPSPALAKASEILAMTHPVGALVYVALIVCFTFFYTSFAVNPIEMAENMKKNGGFIPGIRPGKPTSDYISRTVKRLSTIGSGFYVMLAIIPIIFQWVLGMSAGFGGTTLLIVTGVALEIVKQLESQLLMRHYKGFLS
ncbi:preprotein translocase subunit SecY [Anaeropeptidivorans aminofermentans]|jgi:preprotein translocase subunit SecY|uniref:preprotein translocase subunit SecY n=1 Tax=Anaeropeptidivorans aminofermentans TaxID=2934315 RepID=UPI002024EAE7|nr:preprotein translocase subunit SecY [Anaeropeptidivorans aminofermentans]